jgi:hypothetical protein
VAEPIKDPSGKEVVVIPVEKQDPLADKDRVTSRMTYYYEHRGYDPVSAEVVYTDFLETWELEPQPKRLNKVKNEWHPLPLGDLEPDQVGEFILENLAGKRLTSIPTDEEKQRYAKQTIRIRKAGVEGGLEIIVKPGRAQKVHADPGTMFEIKCDFEEGRGYVWIFPR